MVYQSNHLSFWEFQCEDNDPLQHLRAELQIGALGVTEIWHFYKRHPVLDPCSGKNIFVGGYGTNINAKTFLHFRYRLATTIWLW